MRYIRIYLIRVRMYTGSRIVTSVSKGCVMKSYISEYDGEEGFLIDYLDKYRYMSK